VIETGDPLLAARLDLEQLRASASPEVVRAYEMIGIHSVLMVALRVRGESIGLLSLVRFAPGSRAFDEQDRHLAQALADHAALAIANSRLVRQLEGAVAEHTTEIKVLRELLPICAWCKRVRDDDHGSWGQIEAYVAARTDFVFTHGICPECARNLTGGA
jgi:transcriptional regulator with GAF, ATPase, and Fis domain